MYPRRIAAFALLLLAAVGTAGAQSDNKEEDEDKATRVGTCKDARSQMEYFCEKKNAANDTMVGIGTACTNAKNNVKEACEGLVEADIEYKFDNN